MKKTFDDRTCVAIWALTAAALKPNYTAEDIKNALALAITRYTEFNMLLAEGITVKKNSTGEVAFRIVANQEHGFSVVFDEPPASPQGTT